MNREMQDKVDMIEGCKNRMCITDDRDELLSLYGNLILHATDLYNLNQKRIYNEMYRDKEVKIEL